ncbi:MAG TPA: choice-of-anchor P family protein [Bryobacteraceae bacterium]|nr:choice-of-anchor P family protein [Bryobacteraceae bacterium]
MAKSRFHYHAQAVGLAGHITFPFDQVIDVQAPSALPTSGGRCNAHKESFNLGDIVSHSAAHTQTSGNYDENLDAYVTVATATVENYNLRNILKVKKIVAQLTSTYPAGKGDEPSISPKGSYFEGLEIAGRAIELESHVDTYMRLDTRQKLREHYKNNQQFRASLDQATFMGGHESLPENVRGYFPWSRQRSTGELPENRGTAIVPLFVIKNASAPGFEVYGNVVYVHDFGRIHLGELVIGPYERRLTMVHVDLGSPVKGSLTAASVGGNGGETDPL